MKDQNLSLFISLRLCLLLFVTAIDTGFQFSSHSPFYIFILLCLIVDACVLTQWNLGQKSDTKHSLIILIVLSLIKGANTDYIYTFAGDNTLGFSGDGGPAPLARLNLPMGVSVSKSGVVYIADTNNERIRKVTTDGIITTIAGDGIPGYSGDGGPARSAQINRSYSVDISLDGDIYIADTDNSCIRKIFTNGTITTVAGKGIPGYSGDNGPAIHAELYRPIGIYISSSSDIYIADTYNNRIRIVFINGTITTIAGNGAPGYSGDGGPATNSQLNRPFIVCMLTSGELLISDAYNNRIRKISTDGIITTIAGNGVPGYSGDGGPAINAEISRPFGLAVSPSGDIYFSDAYNNRIRKISADGIITTIAGNGVPGYSGDRGPAINAELKRPYGIAISSSSVIYVADSFNNRIRQISTDGIISDFAGNWDSLYSENGGPALDAKLNQPNGIAVSVGGDVFISDTWNSFVRKICTNGTIINFAGEGNTGYSGDGGLATNAQILYPFGIAVNIDGDVFIADSISNVIRKVSIDGIITTFAGNGVAGYSGDGSLAINAKLNHPYGVSVSSANEVYVADSFNNRIRKIFINNTIVTIAGNGTQGYSGDNGPATSAQLSLPSDVAISPFGEIYIADSYNNRIRKIYTYGIITTFAGNGIPGFSGDGYLATRAQLNNPNGIDICNITGDIYIADTNNNRIRRVSTNGIITTFAGNGNQGYSGDGELATSALLNHPKEVAVSSNEVYIADTFNNVIRITVKKPSLECSSRGYYQLGKYCICSNRKMNTCSSCYGINSGNSSICSGNGTCVSPNHCHCNAGYTGYDCQLISCYGFNQSSPNVCSSHGKCVGPNTCRCYFGYQYPNCSSISKKFFALFSILSIPFLMAIIILTMYYIRKKITKRIKEKELYRKLTEYEIPESEFLGVIAKTDLRIRIEQLTFINRISEGAAGVVYKGKWFDQIVGIKRLKANNLELFVRELSALNRLRHPNIVELYGYSIDSKGYQYIITEFLEKGSLDTILYNNPVKNFEEKIKILLEISNGMSFLHQRGIMHRDLKPSNVLLNQKNICKICDFGLAKIVTDTITVGVIGTWQYIAPEVLGGNTLYNQSCDVYSFGIMMHEIFTLSKPYSSLNSEYGDLGQFIIASKVINGYRPNVPEEVLSIEESDQVTSNIAEYFFKTNELSSSITATSNHIFRVVKMYFALCVSCWSSNPSERPSFMEIIIKLQHIQSILSEGNNNF